jgi:CBS domain-containing protein
MEPISKIMSRDVQVARPDSSVRQVAEQMKSLDVGALPICDGQRLLGMITDRDIALRTVAEGKDPSRTKVSDIMTGEPIWCFEDESTEQVAGKMADHQIRRIPVVSRDKKLVGIVALADIATSQRSPDTKADALEGISEDSGRARS